MGGIGFFENQITARAEGVEKIREGPKPMMEGNTALCRPAVF
jgi:hypothetical protein